MLHLKMHTMPFFTTIFVGLGLIRGALSFPPVWESPIDEEALRQDCGAGQDTAPVSHLCFGKEYESVTNADGSRLWYHCYGSKKKCLREDFESGMCYPYPTEGHGHHTMTCYKTSFKKIPEGEFISGFGYKHDPRCEVGPEEQCTFDPAYIPLRKPGPPEHTYTPEEIAKMPPPERPHDQLQPGESWETKPIQGGVMHCQVDMATYKDGKGTRHCVVYDKWEPRPVVFEFDEPYAKPPAGRVGNEWQNALPSNYSPPKPPVHIKPTPPGEEPSSKLIGVPQEDIDKVDKLLGQPKNSTRSI